MLCYVSEIRTLYMYISAKNAKKEENQAKILSEKCIMLGT